MADIRIGISGWTYAPWRGTFFPPGLKQSEELVFAARQVRSIEINGTFYSLQKPASFARWAESTPDDFIFSVKAPRFITHITRLRGGIIPLANFFASGVLRLGEKLGPILWQLPPSLRFDAQVLESFLESLPRDTAAAARLARRHDAHVPHPWLKAGPGRVLRHALEVRHRSFETPEFIQLLRRHNVAAVVADTAGKWPLIEDVTADFVYVRLHGDEKIYVSGYTPSALRQWAAKIRGWTAGKTPVGATLVAKRPPAGPPRDLYVYFDNDVKTRAPYDAMNLAHLLGLGPKPRRGPSMRSIKELPRTDWPGYPRAVPIRSRSRAAARTRDAMITPPPSPVALPRRIQLSRRKGWKMPADTIVVSRPSRWGNPYRAGTPDERRIAVLKYARFIHSRRGRALRENAIKCLRGHNLACWCPLDGPCHADVLLELVNA